MWRIAALIALTAVAGCTGAAPEASGLREPKASLRMAIDAVIPAGGEEYVCRYFVIPEGGFDVAGFEQRLAPESHHLLLWQTTLVPPDVEDRLDSVIRHCDRDVQSHEAISGMLYGAQPGAASLRYPAGAALRLEPGQVVLLEHHAVNPGRTELAVRAEIDLVAAAGSVHAEAGLLHFYDWAIHVPPRSSSRTRMRCAIDEPLELVFMHGHMHERGRVFRAWVDRGGQTLPLLSTARWDAPTQTPAPPIALVPGDAIEFECSYENADPVDVWQGTSAAHDEMCSLTAGYVAPSGRRMTLDDEICASRGSGVIGQGTLDCAGIEACLAVAVDATADSSAIARQAQRCFLEGCPAKTIPYWELLRCRLEHCSEACGLGEDGGSAPDPAACNACLENSCAPEKESCATPACTQ